MADVLPDSRLHSALGTFMADWTLPDGRVERIEVQPVFCANCGAEHGFVPKDNTTWAFFLCNPCFDKWGVPAGLMVQSDADFWESVHQEMLAKFGRALTSVEVEVLHDQGKLGAPLEALMRDSPIRGNF